MQSKDELSIPRGLPNSEPLVFDMKAIRFAENRTEEIASITPGKAPELMAVFNQAYAELVSMVSAVEYEYETACRKSREIKAVIVLDKVPSILKERGLQTNETTRQAIIDLDPDYQSAQETETILHSFKTLLEGKKKSIEMSYTAVKKILGDSFHAKMSLPGPDSSPTQGYFGKTRY